MREPVRWTEEEAYLVAQLAREIALQGRYEDALTILEGLAQAVPGDAYARRAAAAVRLQMGQAAEALAWLGQGAGDPATARLRLECLLALGRTGDAGREFRAVEARLDPGERARFRLMLEPGENKQLPGAGLDN